MLIINYKYQKTQYLTNKYNHVINALKILPNSLYLKNFYNLTNVDKCLLYITNNVIMSIKV